MINHWMKKAEAKKHTTISIVFLQVLEMSYLSCKRETCKTNRRGASEH
jgi:hypothetical protein